MENYYQPTGQSSNDCFYYPVFTETPDSIVLPGACPTISAKPNFEPARVRISDVFRFALRAYLLLIHTKTFGRNK